MSTTASRARQMLRSRSGALSVELVISLPVLALFYVGWAYFGLAYDARMPSRGQLTQRLPWRRSNLPSMTRR